MALLRRSDLVFRLKLVLGETGERGGDEIDRWRVRVWIWGGTVLALRSRKVGDDFSYSGDADPLEGIDNENLDSAYVGGS